jgi:nitrite reductase (NO-forming)
VSFRPPTTLGRLRSPIDRSFDRLIALAAVAIAISYLLAAVVAVLLPIEVRRAAWLSLHLALAGGATSAIAGVMPYFTSAFAAAPPADRWLRIAALAGVSIGALGVAVGVAGDQMGLAVSGGLGFVGGVGLTGIAALRPLGQGLGPSRGLVTKGYVVALAEVGLGVSIATLYLAGWGPVVGAWAQLKPAHAWLNLVGFVSLAIATTLLHFFPTVIGARISRRASTTLTVVGLGAGAPIVALGYAIASDTVARLGAIGAALGAAGLATYATQSWRTRARWTTDLAWHRYAIGGLVSAIVWFEIGIAIAAGRVLEFGADSGGWSVDVVAGPLVGGWIGLTIVASATHLIPAIGPGDPIAHGRQRHLLGRAANSRLAVINLGVALLSTGLVFRNGAATQAGIVGVGIGLGATAALIGAAIRIGIW